MEQYDRFGGWKEIKSDSTGFFRLQEADRWWLVTPEGNAFISLGVNHIQPTLLFHEYNREHWSKEMGYKEEAFSGESFAASPAREKWLSMVKDDLGRWGFNTIGGLSNISQCPKEVPYTVCVRFVDNCHWMKAEDISFPDVFDPAFKERCREMARKACAPRREDPYLVGYFYMDTPILVRRDAQKKEGLFYYDNPRAEVPTWPQAISELPGEAPGKRYYVDFIRARYQSKIDAFNEVYGTSFGSFEELVRSSPPRKPRRHQQAHEDGRAFLREILRHLYHVAHEAVREFDPNHLILGDRYNGNTEIPDAALEAMLPYVDVLSVQYYGHFREQEADLKRCYGKTGKPIILCDSAFSVPSPEMPNPFGRWVENEEQRAVAYEGYARAAFSNPYVIGWHWCGYIDRWAEAQGPRQHTGIRDAFGRDHPVAQAMSRMNAKVYRIAAGALRGDGD